MIRNYTLTIHERRTGTTCDVLVLAETAADALTIAEYNLVRGHTIGNSEQAYSISRIVAGPPKEMDSDHA